MELLKATTKRLFRNYEGKFGGYHLNRAERGQGREKNLLLSKTNA